MSRSMWRPGYNCVCDCALCGTSFNAKSRAAMYCSPSCKQKAYRERKKQEAVARSSTMPMRTYMEINALSEKNGDINEVINDFAKEHGNSAAADLVSVIAWFTGIERDGMI